MAKDLKERLRRKKAELAKKGSKGGIIFLKEGTKRVRVLPVGEDNEFAFEVTQYYLGGDIKGVFSPTTFGEPCAITEAYESIKASKDDADQAIAKSLIPKKKFLMPVLVYSDSKGKKVDKDDSGKLVQITNGMYESIIDLYLDQDEWGDMTDPKNGYDLKLTREGTTMTDTEYSVQPCKNTPIPKGWNKEIDLEEIVRNLIPSYEETKEKIDQFLGIDDDADEHLSKMGKKKKITKKKTGLKKRRKVKR